jgi:hypothetical protein
VASVRGLLAVGFTPLASILLFRRAALQPASARP